MEFFNRFSRSNKETRFLIGYQNIKEILRRSLGDHLAQFIRIKTGSCDQLVRGELGLIKKITVNDAAVSR